MEQISLAALLIVGRAANSNLHGLRAMGIRILATAALCYALYDAIRQLPLLEQDSPEAENSFGPAEAETSNMEIGTSCKALAGGDEEGGADSSSLCLTPEAADAITAKFGSRWLADMVGGAMYDGGDSSTGSWLETKFAVVQFWGLTSVVAYLALVEALPVLLRPLHVFVRWVVCVCMCVCVSTRRRRGSVLLKRLRRSACARLDLMCNPAPGAEDPEYLQSSP